MRKGIVVLIGVLFALISIGGCGREEVVPRDCSDGGQVRELEVPVTGGIPKHPTLADMFDLPTYNRESRKLSELSERREKGVSVFVEYLSQTATFSKVYYFVQSDTVVKINAENQGRFTDPEDVDDLVRWFYDEYGVPTGIDSLARSPRSYDGRPSYTSPALRSILYTWDFGSCYIVSLRRTFSLDSNKELLFFRATFKDAEPSTE